VNEGSVDVAWCVLTPSYLQISPSPATVAQIIISCRLLLPEVVWRLLLTPILVTTANYSSLQNWCHVLHTHQFFQTLAIQGPFALCLANHPLPALGSTSLAILQELAHFVPEQQQSWHSNNAKKRFVCRSIFVKILISSFLTIG